MNTPFASLFRQSSLVVLLLGLLLFAGCAEWITFAERSRREGIRLYNGGNFEGAAGAFRNATRQDPRDYRSYFYMGAAYEQLKDYVQAISAYRACLDVMKVTFAGKDDPEFRARVLDGLASAIAKSDRRNTELDLTEKQARNTQTAESWYLLAKVYRFTGDADSALNAYNRAALLDSRSHPILKEYGLYLEKLGQTQKAEVPLRKAYALQPQDEQVVAALRRLGVVPGPAIKDEKELVQPIMPKGPIPDVDVNKLAPVPVDPPLNAPRD